jgi:hypothetical protein
MEAYQGDQRVDKGQRTFEATHVLGAQVAQEGLPLLGGVRVEAGDDPAQVVPVEPLPEGEEAAENADGEAGLLGHHGALYQAAVVAHLCNKDADDMEDAWERSRITRTTDM